MPANIGSQVITIKFFDPVDSIIVDRVAKELRRVGIYSGGYLTKVSDTSVSLSTLATEISDGTYQVRGETTAAVTVTVGAATPYVVLRWIYTGSASVDYMAFLALDLGSILPNDVVVGKCTYSGATLTGFDYTLRTNPLVMYLFLRVEATDPTSMRCWVRAGRVCYGPSNIDIVLQQTPLFTAPTSNSRIDLVQINNSGTIIVTQGTAAALPVAPDYGGFTTLAEVTLTAGQTAIIPTNIKDVRGFVVTSAIPSQAGNSGKVLTSNGTTAVWDYGTYAP